MSQLPSEDILDELRNLIKSKEDNFKTKYPFLKHQNALGLIIMFSAAFLVVLSALAYIYGYIPALVCIVLIAFFVSFLHEIEHDTFHNQYFSNRRIPQNAMLMFCWLFKPNTINPWIRKIIHLHHHIYSGTPEDIEEQLIGNGSPYHIKRFLIMSDPTFALLQFKRLKRNSHAFYPGIMLLSAIHLFILLLASGPYGYIYRVLC